MKAGIATASVAALFLASSMYAHTVGLRLALLGAGIVLAATFCYRRDEIGRLPPIWLPFLLWGAWAAASLAWSLDAELTAKEWRNEVFYTAAACWVCYVAAQSRHALRIFAAIAAAGAAAACAIALYEFSRGWQGYTAGLHGGPGDHSSMLLVVMPCVAMGGWYAIRTRRPAAITAALAALAVLIVASAYTTLNRTIWLGFAAQFGVLGFVVLTRRQAATPWLVRGAVAGAAILCVAMTVAIQAQREVVGAGGALKSEPRLLLWPQVLEHMRASPVTGYGFGRGMLREALQAKLRGRDTNLWHAHNIFFETVLQLGLPGLALFLWLLAATLREAWRGLRDPDDAVAACGMALAAVVVGVLVRNMTDTLLVRQNALLYWGVVGAMLGLAQRLRSRAGNSVTAPVGG